MEVWSLGQLEVMLLAREVSVATESHAGLGQVKSAPLAVLVAVVALGMEPCRTWEPDKVSTFRKPHTRMLEGEAISM